MKWIVKTMLMLTGILPLFKCSSGYKEDKGKITFNGKEITDKNFVVLNKAFAKDSTTAYYKEWPFSYADVATFEAVDEHYAKDRNKVYYCDEYREGQNYYLTKRQTIMEVSNAQPASFEVIGYGYARDQARAYFEGLAFNVKDITTLKSIDLHFANDDVQAYLNLQPIAGSDGKSFELINQNYAKDKAHIYYYGYTGDKSHDIGILPCDRATFEILDYPYSRDKASVYFARQKINGADPATFTILGSGYSKDRETVYFEGERISGADVATFELYKENESSVEDFSYARDKAAVFINQLKIKGADVLTFKVLTLGYGSDSRHVFYKSSLVKDASPASFKVYPHTYDDADAEDARNKYLKGEKL